MTILRRNKKGRYSEPLSRSSQDWERGRGAKRKGNPRYMPSTTKGRKVYVLRTKDKKTRTDTRDHRENFPNIRTIKTKKKHFKISKTYFSK